MDILSIGKTRPTVSVDYMDFIGFAHLSLLGLLHGILKLKKKQSYFKLLNYIIFLIGKSLVCSSA